MDRQKRRRLWLCTSLAAFLLFTALIVHLIPKGVAEMLKEYTTTEYAPWWRIYHLTSEAEAAARYKGGDGGQMNWSMAVSPTDPDTLLYGTDTSGIWKSTDGGASWRLSCEGLKTFGTVGLAFDPDDGNIAYVAGCLHTFPSTVNEQVGVYRSRDGGATWEMVLRADFHREHSNRLIQFGSPDEKGVRPVYVATHGSGVFVSPDRGLTWTCLGLTGNTFTDLHADGDLIVAASNESGILVSEDGGATWAASNQGLPRDGAYTIAVDPANPDRWFTLVPGSLQVFCSADRGKSWAPRATVGVGGEEPLRKLLFGALNPNGPAVLYLTLNMNSPQFRYSDDLGVTWKTPVLHNEIALRDQRGYWAESTVVHPADPLTAWTVLDGVTYKTTDGGVNWQLSNSGLSGFRNMKTLFDAEGNPTYMAILDHGLFKATGTPEPYRTFMHLPDVLRYNGVWSAHSIAQDPQDSDHLLAKIGDWGSNLILEESFDAGKTWAKVRDTGGNYGSLLEYHPSAPNVVYAGKLRSDDGGRTWTMLEKTVCAVSPLEGDIVYAIEGTNIFQSADRGNTWKSLGVTIYGPQRLTVDRFVPDRLWLGLFSGGLARIDGGEVKFFDETNGLVKGANGNLNIFSIAQDPGDPLHLFAGGVDSVAHGPGSGLFETFDGGENWEPVPGMPGTLDIWVVQVNPVRPLVYATTSSGTLVYDWSLRARK